MKTVGPKRAFLMLAALLLQATIAIGAVNITVQPASVTSVADGAKITLSVTATSTNTAATFSYQWFKLNGAIPEFFGAASSKNTISCWLGTVGDLLFTSTIILIRCRLFGPNPLFLTEFVKLNVFTVAA